MGPPVLEGALVVLGAPPPVEIGVPLPEGTWLAFHREEARIPSRGRMDPDAVLLLHQAEDGTVAFMREATDWRARVSLVDASGELGAWDLERAPGAVAEVDGRWMVLAPPVVEVRDRTGALLTRTDLACPRAGGAFPVDGGLRGVCEGRPWTVSVDGTLTHGAAATVTLASGAVLDVAPDGFVSRRGPEGQVWTAPVQGGVVGSPDGTRVLVGGALLDVATGARLSNGGFEGWSRDGDLIASSGPGWIRHDPATGEPRTRADGHTEFLQSLAWSPDGRRLVSVGHDRQVLVWDPRGGPPLGRLPVEGWVQSVTFADGALLLGVSGEFSRWVLGEERPRYTREGVGAPYGRGRVVVVEEDRVSVLDPDGNPVYSWRCPLVGHHGQPVPVSQAVSVRGRLLAVAAGRLWDVERSEAVFLGVDRVEVTPDGDAALICDGARTTGSWPEGRTGDVQGCGDPRSMTVETSSWVSPDGERVAVPMRGGGIAIRSNRPSVVRDRAPRDVIVVGAPEELPDPEVLVAGLQVAHVVGDRVTWIVPGTPSSRWIEVHDEDAARDLAAIGRRGSDDDRIQAAICRGQQLLADGGRPGLVVVMTHQGSPQSCPAGRDADTRFAHGAREILSVVRPGW